MTRPETGTCVEIDPGIRRIIAPNPGPMTFWGTNTWILGEGDVAIIDPGPNSDAHFNAILNATQGQRVSQILVTHAHADHSPLARRVSDHVNAPVFGFGPPQKGRTTVMQRLASTEAIEGGEGVDSEFLPDTEIEDGDTLSGDGWSLTARHTPGHFAGHLAFQFGEVVFSGDHVMDWATTLISPPDGDMGQFYATSDRLLKLAPSHFMPGHGAVVTDPQGRLEELIGHRRKREVAILNAVADGKATLGDITSAVYSDVPKELHPAAARNALAHVIDLVEQSILIGEPGIAIDAHYRLREPPL